MLSTPRIALEISPLCASDSRACLLIMVKHGMVDSSLSTEQSRVLITSNSRPTAVAHDWHLLLFCPAKPNTWAAGQAHKLE
jgi:hypothetical protein